MLFNLFVENGREYLLEECMQGQKKRAQTGRVKIITQSKSAFFVTNKRLNVKQH